MNKLSSFMNSFMGAAKNVGKKVMEHPGVKGFTQGAKESLNKPLVSGTKDAIKNFKPDMVAARTTEMPSSMKTFHAARAVGRVAPVAAGGAVAAVGAKKILSGGGHQQPQPQQQEKQAAVGMTTDIGKDIGWKA